MLLADGREDRVCTNRIVWVKLDIEEFYDGMVSRKTRSTLFSLQRHQVHTSVCRIQVFRELVVVLAESFIFSTRSRLRKSLEGGGDQPRTQM